MKKIKAVLFDMDGLMVDTEPLHLQAFKSIFNKYGEDLTEEENAARYIGISDAEAAEDMVVRFHLPISIPELIRMKHEKSLELYQTDLKSQPGLISLLKNLKKAGLKTAIVSGSELVTIRKIMNLLGIEKLIGQIISAEEVKKGKPAPDVYLLAAHRLKIKPAECLVLEDAPKGVQAAKAAGMLCFAIPSKYVKNEDFSLADKVLGSLSEVFSLL